MLSVTYNGVTAESVGARVLSISPPTRAARRIQTIYIPGRDGTLHIDDGSYEPITKTILLGFRTLDALDAIHAWLMGSGSLTVSTEPGRLYKVVQAVAVPWERIVSPIYQVNISFECQPLKYLDPPADDIVLDVEGGDVTNPATAPAAPLWNIAGTGDIMLTVGNLVISLTEIITGITIDSELMTAYQGTEPMDSHVHGDYPLLSPGVTAISCIGDVSAITITPRWRYL